MSLPKLDKPILLFKDDLPAVSDDELYPSEDGQPMAQSYEQLINILTTAAGLIQYYVDAPNVLVNADQFLYYLPNAPTAVLAPDVFVTFGVSKEPPRKSFKVWEEGRFPDVIFEILSDSTADADLISKRDTYLGLGVGEYWIYDPYRHRLDPPIVGYLRQPSTAYARVEGERLSSKLLKLDLYDQQGLLRLFDPQRGETLLTLNEITPLYEQARQRLRDLEKQLADAEARATEAEAARAIEATRAAEAESRLATALAELAKLRSES